MPVFQNTISGTLSGLPCALTAAAVLAAPRIATACAVCISGRDDETQLAFRISTGAMTLLPFLLVGGLLWWLRRRFRALAEEQERLAVRGAQPIAQRARMGS